MKCKNCGNDLEAGMNFCEQCGIPVPKEDAVQQDEEHQNHTEPQDHRLYPEHPMKQDHAAIHTDHILEFQTDSFQKEPGPAPSTISIEKNKLIKIFAAAAGIALLIVAAVVFMRISGDKTEKASADNISQTEEEHTSADYDTDVWDYRLPVLPGYVSQEFYAIFYEKSRDNRIELSVFDIEGDLDGNHIVWSGTGNPLVLYNQNVIKNCDQFYYDGSKWVEFNSDYYRIGDSAKNIISSNLDIRDSDGKMVQPHITSSGISEPLDLSGYQEASEPAKKEEETASAQKRTVEKVYIYPESPDEVYQIDPEFFNGTWSGTYIGISNHKKTVKEISLYIGMCDSDGNVQGVAEIEEGNAGYYYWEGFADFESGVFSFERKKWLSENPDHLKKLTYITTYNAEEGYFNGYITKDPERTIQFARTANDEKLVRFWDAREDLINQYN